MKEKRRMTVLERTRRAQRITAIAGLAALIGFGLGAGYRLGWFDGRPEAAEPWFPAVETEAETEDAGPRDPAGVVIPPIRVPEMPGPEAGDGAGVPRGDEGGTPWRAPDGPDTAYDGPAEAADGMMAEVNRRVAEAWAEAGARELAEEEARKLAEEAAARAAQTPKEPAGPKSGDTKIVDGVEYKYASSIGEWVIPSGGGGNANFELSGNIVGY